MREAAVPGYRLSKAKPSVRILTSFALIALFIGIFASVGLTVVKTGITASQVQEYYLGVSNQHAEGSLDAMLHPAVKRSVVELLEITHIHLMGGSLLLFLLCHLLSVCELSERSRITIYSVSFASYLLTFGVPWGVMYLSPLFAYVYAPSIILFFIALFLMIAIPLREMWLK